MDGHPTKNGINRYWSIAKWTSSRQSGSSGLPDPVLKSCWRYSPTRSPVRGSASSLAAVLAMALISWPKMEGAMVMVQARPWVQMMSPFLNLWQTSCDNELSCDKELRKTVASGGWFHHIQSLSFSGEFSIVFANGNSWYPQNRKAAVPSRAQPLTW